MGKEAIGVRNENGKDSSATVAATNSGSVVVCSVTKTFTWAHGGHQMGQLLTKLIIYATNVDGRHQFRM